MPSDITKPNRDLNLLAPFFERKLTEALSECESMGLNVRLFEGYRSPSRQDYLYQQGRSRPGVKVTRAQAWQSWHQLSVAADVVFYDAAHKQWVWEGAWDKVHAVFHNHGFETLEWESPHIQIRGGFQIAEAVKIAKSQGALALWNLIEQRL